MTLNLKILKKFENNIQILNTIMRDIKTSKYLFYIIDKLEFITNNIKF